MANFNQNAFDRGAAAVRERDVAHAHPRSKREAELARRRNQAGHAAVARWNKEQNLTA